MARLDQLPLEVIELIYYYLHPSSIVAFASTSKHLHYQSINVLEEHQSYRQKYEEITDRLPDTVPRALLDILREPWLAWYIRRVIFHNGRRGWKHGEALGVNVDSEHKGGSRSFDAIFCSAEDKALLRTAIGSNFRLRHSPTIIWMRQLERGKDLVYKVLLLSSVPCLSELVVQLSTGEPGGSAIKWIGDMFRSGAYIPVERRPRFLLSLTKIALNGRPSGRAAGRRKAFGEYCLSGFFTLPTLKTMVLRGFGSHVPHDWNEGLTDQFQNSRLEHLDLGSFKLAEGNLKAILRHSRNLKSLRMGTRPALTDTTIEDLLLETCGDTLTSLNIATPLFGISLRQFQKLENIVLRVTASISEPGVPFEVESFAQLLPPSIVRLKIAGCSSLHSRLYHCLCNLLGQKDQSYPRLHRVCLRRLPAAAAGSGSGVTQYSQLWTANLQALSEANNVVLSYSDQRAYSQVDPSPTDVLG